SLKWWSLPIGRQVDAGWSAFHFFFQAEDGIRDRNVTGVQTCALPIYTSSMCLTENRWLVGARTRTEEVFGTYSLASRLATYLPRSEERRVGKECRTRW